MLFFFLSIFYEGRCAIDLSLVLVVNVFEPFLFGLGHEISGVDVPPSAFLTRLVVLARPLLSRPLCSHLLACGTDLHHQNIYVEGDFLGPDVHVVSDDDPCDHINDEVSADAGHHEPLVAHDEQHEILHLEPFARAVLQCHYETGADVPRIKKVI